MRRLRYLWILTAVAVLILAMPTRGAFAQATPGTQAEDAEAARIDRVWNRLWREFAPFYVEHAGEFICVPGYDRRLPSSLGQSARDYIRENTKDVEYTDERGRDRVRTLTKPEDEAQAVVRAIPEIAVGQYGYIHSGNIRTITGEQSVRLNQVWLLDAGAIRDERKERMDQVVRDGLGDIEDAIRNRGRDERRNRGDNIIERRAAERDAIRWMYEDREALAQRQAARAFSRYQWEVIGYQTGRLTEGLRWPAGDAADDGLQLIIVDVTGTTVTAIPAQRIGGGLSEIDFLNCLEDRGLTKAQFVEMVNEAKREDRRGYAALVLNQLEGVTHEPTDESDVPDAPAEQNDTVELAD